MNLEDSLREALRASGLSIKAMADRAGVPYMSAYSFYHGTRTLTLPLAGRLAALVGLELRPVRRKRKGS